MAKYQAVLHGSLNQIVLEAEKAIGTSISSSSEESSFFNTGEVKFWVKAYERYSYIGKNRVSLTITYVETGGEIYVTAITTGGSQAMFFKINTFGEQAFLDTVTKVFEKYKIRNF